MWKNRKIDICTSDAPIISLTIRNRNLASYQFNNHKYIEIPILDKRDGIIYKEKTVAISVLIYLLFEF